MAFVKFTETGKSFAPKASINPRGYLSFNDGARRRCHLDKYKFAVLAYDPDENKVGVELTNDETSPGAVKLRQRATGATIGAKAFLDYFDVHIGKTTVYDAVWDATANMIVLDLNAGRERNAKDDDLKDDDKDEEEQDPLAVGDGSDLV